MVNRCHYVKDKDYKNYGARGITVCSEWRGFAAFKEWAYENGYRRGLQIDRIDNDGDYHPLNCKFATALENAGHKRSSVMLTVIGETACASEWARRINRDPSLVLRWARVEGKEAATKKVWERVCR